MRFVAASIVLVATVLAAGAVQAQTPMHDRTSMPGMDEPVTKKTATGKKPAKKTKRAVGARAKPEAAHATMDHGTAHHDMPNEKPHDVQDGPPHDLHEGMQHDAHPAMPMDHAHDAHSGTTAPSPHAMSSMDGATMPGPVAGPMHGGAAPADARDPDAYANGLEAHPMHGMDMADDAWRGAVLIDRLEVAHDRDGHAQVLDAQGRYGGDLDRLWWKVDGERHDGRLGATRTEALWDHAIASAWSAQGGVRHDFGDGPGRTWAAFGVQGIAPYWFDVQATAYVGEGGRTALRFEGEYDLRITRRIVLQPDVEVEAFGRDDPRRAIGAGLSRLEAAVRLRYEVTRRVAPYVGVVWSRRTGNTARFARDAGRPVERVEAVMGLRLRF